MNLNPPYRSPPGQSASLVDQYDPGLLSVLPREARRREIGITGSVPFLGADLWTAFELSWLNARGKPVVALAHITVPCESTHIIESKSFRRYLDSFSGTRFDHAEAVRERLKQDIGQAIWHGAAVPSSAGVRLLLPEVFACEPVQELEGLSLDRLDLECTHQSPAPQLLTAAFGEKPVEETLVSHLLRSDCQLTGQPGRGSLQIRYSGPQIEQAGLLQYIVSLRHLHGLREQCVEHIYMDIMKRCKPARLMVYARYTRRGGLDINPWRSSHPQLPPANVRTARQ
jgi:7-cyano-7-deazaguanine reductase